ncbi:MAG: DNA polymerase I [Chloroflexi bacterium]|nr:DNA polymerase I [Chloroflexota bacterium]MBE3114273.1 DNA polymerase I [Actinomycetota bacterium]
MKSGRNNKVILIDGNNIAYRAFYALPDSISTSSGIITNAVLGFTNMLLKLIEEQHPDTILCAFDSKTPTFRHKIFDRYKINRKKMPTELSSQFPLIKEVLDVFNIIYLERDGFEADDILAGIVNSIKDEFNQIIIVTGDKDILQLVSGNIKVMAIKKGITDTVIFDRLKVEEKFGVKPENMKDLLALMGDSSDNIPGVPGIGPKTARLLVKKYGCLEEIYKNINKVDNPRLRELLTNNKKLAELSKELTTLKIARDTDVSEFINKSFKNISFNKVKQLFESLEFRSLEKRLVNLKDKIDFKEEIPVVKKRADKINLKRLTGGSNLEILNKNLTKNIYITEFTGGDVFYGIILYSGVDSAFLIEKDSLNEGTIKETIKKLLENKEIEKSGFDFKRIYKILKDYGICLSGKFIDYKILYLILNPLKSTTTLDEITGDLLNIEIEDIELSEGKDGSDLIEFKDIKEKKQLTLDLYKDEKQKIKADKKYLDGILRRLSLYKKIETGLLEKIKKEKLDKLYWRIEEPLIQVLAEMEYTGVNIDNKYLSSLIEEYELDIERLEKEIYKLCGEEFNINSSQQLSEILYRKLNLPVTKKTKTGFSTDAGALKAIYDSSPIIRKILDWREKTKLKNTYIDVLPALIDPEDLRVHTTYNQLGTSTGRISSSDPNLQNIPVRTDYGRQIRKAFIPGKGYDLILASDYSQIELRVLAHLSGDENLLGSFNRKEDIHTRTASEIFRVSYDDVDVTLRRKAKAINFGIIYGMTEYGLKSRLSISEEEAKEYIQKYFDRYPGVKKYLKFLIDDAYKKGYTTTIFGRKRYLKELGSSNVRIRSLGERFAVNTPIQGSAADIMKLSTVILFNKLKLNNIESNIILHVHDELVLELKERDLEKIKKIVIESMENCVSLKVNLRVDIKTGKNWYI